MAFHGGSDGLFHLLGPNCGPWVEPVLRGCTVFACRRAAGLSLFTALVSPSFD
jgi:hypothetical protein